MNVFDRHANMFGKRAMRIEDSHHSSACAVAREILPARSTLSAPEVDLANHSLANDFRRTRFPRADKLVARYTREAHVAVKDLQIGSADAGKMNFDQSR